MCSQTKEHSYMRRHTENCIGRGEVVPNLHLQNWRRLLWKACYVEEIDLVESSNGENECVRALRQERKSLANV